MGTLLKYGYIEPDDGIHINIGKPIFNGGMVIYPMIEQIKHYSLNHWHLL
jgi:hypothetical protein